MTDYEDFIVEQEVKYFMYYDYEELVSMTSGDYYFPSDSFSLKHFAKLEDILLHNQENKLVYGEMQSHLYELMSFLENYVELEWYEIIDYHKAIDNILSVLDEVRPVSFDEFFTNEVKIRYQVSEVKISTRNYDFLYQNLVDSMSRDLDNAYYLEPSVKTSFSLDNPIENHYSILSFAYFYQVYNDLFKNPVILKKLRCALMKIINHDYDCENNYIIEPIKDNARKLLEKVIVY